MHRPRLTSLLRPSGRGRRLPEAPASPASRGLQGRFVSVLVVGCILVIAFITGGVIYKGSAECPAYLKLPINDQGHYYCGA